MCTGVVVCSRVGLYFVGFFFIQHLSAKLYQFFCLCRRGSRIVCPYHPDANLIEDYHAGDMICPDCGLVVGDRYGSASSFHPVYCSTSPTLCMAWTFWSTAACQWFFFRSPLIQRSYLEYFVENAQNTTTCITLNLCKICWSIFLDSCL